jgi:glycosyltransferase involved in cell wall biosynthesis
MDGGKDPLISVIVCTFNRYDMLTRALVSVASQNRDDLEVIVVDDGSDIAVELGGILPKRVRLIRTEHRGVGAARSEGLHAARGEFIAYCDDDDEWKTNHLRILLEYLTEHPEVDLVYADSEWEQPGTPPSVPYSFDFNMHSLSGENYIFASDVMHRARAAQAVGGFDPSLQAFEDWDLWLRMSQAHTIRHLPKVLTVHHWHEGCVSANKNWNDWDRVFRHRQLTLSKRGLAEDDLVRNEGPRVVPFNPNTWQPGRRELLWHSLLKPSEGYGSVGWNLLQALERQGVEVSLAPTKNQPIRGLERFYRSVNRWDRIGLYHHYWARPGTLKCERIVNFSMWESTLVPREMVDEINQSVTLQCVPCKQNAECFRDCGVRAPLEILHLGVDAARYPYLDRDHSGPFTFGTYGDLAFRKGIDVLVRAFRDEFARSEPVRLVLKDTGNAALGDLTDPRIEILRGVMNHEELLGLLGEMDVFVLPSRGEGFGLCGLEAMSTGLPLIATNWSGPAEYLDPADSYPLAYRLVNAGGIESKGVRYFGQWAEPDYEHLRHLMRLLYEHRDQAKSQGRLASERVHRKWTWDRVAHKLCNVLDGVATR